MGKVVVSLRMIRLHTRVFSYSRMPRHIAQVQRVRREVMMSVDRSPLDFERMAEKIGAVPNRACWSGSSLGDREHRIAAVRCKYDLVTLLRLTQPLDCGASLRLEAPSKNRNVPKGER